MLAVPRQESQLGSSLESIVQPFHTSSICSFIVIMTLKLSISYMCSNRGHAKVYGKETAKYSRIKKQTLKPRKSSKVQRVTSLGNTSLQNGPSSDYTTENWRFFDRQFTIIHVPFSVPLTKCPGRRHVSAEPLYETLTFPSSVLRNT